MTAREARELTNSNISKPDINPYMEQIMTRVKEAAKEGHNSIKHPETQFTDLPQPSSDVQRAILMRICELGYTISVLNYRIMSW